MRDDELNLLCRIQTLEDKLLRLNGKDPHKEEGLIKDLRKSRKDLQELKRKKILLGA